MMLSGLLVAASLLLASGVFGQATRVEVGREVSRASRPELFRVRPGLREDDVSSQELARREEYGNLEVLQDTTPQPTFSLNVFSGVSYTTNAPLAANNEIADWYFNQGLAFGWSKSLLNGTLYPHVSLYNAWFEYTKSEHGVDDFSSMDVTIGLTYVLKKLGGVAFSVDYTYERLANLNFSDEFFWENHLKLGLNKAFSISRTHSLFVQGFGDLSLSTQPSSAERNGYGAAIGYGIDWTPEISTVLSYRYTHYPYLNGPRVDNNQSVVLSLQWRITKRTSLSLSANFVKNSSNLEPYAYRAFTVGSNAGITMQW